MGSFPETYNDPDIDTRGKFDTDTPRHWIPGTGFRILCQWNLDYGLWITDSDRSWDCLTCIPDSKATIPRFYSKSLLDSGIQIPLHGANTLSSIKIN